MRSDKQLSYPDNTQKRVVTDVINDVFGTEVDLLSEEGRVTALQKIDEISLDDSDIEVTSVSEFEEVPADDTRTAWQVARGNCADLQLGAALKLLDKLKPLIDSDMVDSSDGEPVDFVDLKGQIKDQLSGLRMEFKQDADDEVINNFFHTLLEDDCLFDNLRYAGNYYDKHVNNRGDEREVSNYLTIRAFVGELCAFPIDKCEPASEPKDAGTSHVKHLSAVVESIRCIADVSVETKKELADMGITEDCAPSRIPGVKFMLPQNIDPEQPVDKRTTRSRRIRSIETADISKLFTLIKRSESESGRWLVNLEKHGKQGAKNIRSEIDLISDKANSYKPVLKDGEGPKVAYMLDLFVSKYSDAADEIDKLLG